MERDFEYEKNNVGYDWQSPNGYGIKCKNYIICEAVLPNWWFQCKCCYLCTNCHQAYGTWGPSHRGNGILDIFGETKLECPICLETKKCISQPTCNHHICIDCFKRCYYEEKSNDEPIFPYSSDIEDEYESDQLNAKWDNDYPLINIYNEEWNRWEDAREEKYESEQNLRKCPICRK